MADQNTNSPITPEAIVEQLRALRSQIPEYQQLPVVSARQLASAASVDPKFVHATINGIGASERVQAVLGTSAEDMRQEADDSVRWGAVEDELRAMLKGVATANLKRRHRIGLTALQTYSITKQLIRQDEHADLLPHFREMRRLNPFGRHRKATPEEPPQPQPQPHIQS
jgi:hypothetical protein